MHKFVYTAYLPGIDAEAKLTELPFSVYKQLVKTILNDNDACIIDALNETIRDCSNYDDNALTFLDKLIVLLMIRAVCISPVLELTITHPSTEQKYNLTFNISDIIEKLSNIANINELRHVKKTYGPLRITYGIPAQFYFTTKDDFIISAIKKIIINDEDVTHAKKDIISNLPLNVYKDITSHTSNLQKIISNVALLSVKIDTPDEETNIQITPDIFNDSTLEFLKLCYKRDLSSLYELEYSLSAELNLPYQLIESSTFAELTVYISVYNEAQKRKEKEKQPTPSIP